MAARKALTKRPDGRYARSVSYEDPATGQTRRHTVYGVTVTETNALAVAARKRLSEGAPVRDASRTLAEWLTEWRATSLAASDRAPSTRTLYASLTAKHIEPVLGDLTLAKLRPNDIQRLVLAMQGNGLSASTIRSTYAALRSALDDAVSNGLLAVNPVHKVKRPKSMHTERHALTPEQARALVETAGSNNRNRPDEEPRYARAMRLLLLTGLRRGELLALRWQDIDLARSEATVCGSLVRQGGQLVVGTPKTARSARTVALSPSAVALLKAQAAAQSRDRLRAANVWADHGMVFTTENGSPVDPRNLLRAVSAAAVVAGLPSWVGVHTLRHTYATNALLAGVPIHVVSRNLGHSSISITADTYAHLSDDAASSAASKVADALGL